MDTRFAAAQIERLLLDGSAKVDAVSAEKLWLREDGTCSLRYRVRLSGHPGPAESTATVLAWVHPTNGAGSLWADRLVSAAAARGVGPESPWRTYAGIAPEAALVLARFPIDPYLPTLPDVLDPNIVGRLGPFATCPAPPVATLVHHPREGACVLRYRIARGSGAGDVGAWEVLYGKVYGDDDRGAVVDGFLRALDRQQSRQGVRLAARFPRPVLYEPRLRLLLTEALPGEPLVPRLLKSRLASRGEGRSHDTTVLKAAVRDSGRALAVLHGSDLATAPVHPATREANGLRAEFDVVRRIWPDVAQRLRGTLDRLLSDVPNAPDLVLSHGDFTPSQVLLDGEVPAVVDLDTLCWADPTLDLGRYLAHLELLAVKVGGPTARGLVETLAGEFLGGYGEVTARSASGAAALNRVAFYKCTTLARTALHSCRQLKGYRLDLALSLLDDVHAGRADL